MSETKPFDTEALVDAMAPLLGFDAIDDYRGSIVTNLNLTLGFADLVMSFSLDDHEEPAEVFRA